MAVKSHEYKVKRAKKVKAKKLRQKQFLIKNRKLENQAFKYKKMLDKVTNPGVTVKNSVAQA